jgi:NifU-like protein
MTPAELYLDHARTPRNQGKLLNAHATGDVGSIVVGDALRFYIQVTDERITAAKFQVFNAQAQVPSASAVTELAVGRSLDQALVLAPADVAAHLGGLDAYALPPRLWALDALRVAVGQWRGEHLAEDEPVTEPLLCRCHNISEETVKQSIMVMDLHTVDEVIQATGAGTGCGTCRLDLPRLLDEVRSTPKPGAPAAPPRAGRVALIRRIHAAVSERFLPALKERCTDLELRDLDGSTVVVRLSGGLATDDAAARECLAELEVFLKTEIEPELGVRRA